jgi:hypothetical protein
MENSIKKPLDHQGKRQKDKKTKNDYFKTTSTSLRRYYPDQVQRVGNFPSQLRPHPQQQSIIQRTKLSKMIKFQ